MRQIVIAAPVVRDLDQHFDYIAQQDESAALRFLMPHEEPSLI